MTSLVDELLGVVPRLLDRTRDQIDLATRLLQHLPCVAGLAGDRAAEVADDGGGGSASGSSRRVDVSEESTLAAVVPLRADQVHSSAAAAAVDEVIASSLAIPGYDELAASQVMPRLDALDADQLEAVRRYEASHRGRRTILARIAHMQAL